MQNTSKRSAYTVKRIPNQPPPAIHDIGVVLLHRKGALTIYQAVKKLEPYQLFECAVLVHADDLPDPLDDLMRTCPWVTFIVFTGSSLPGTRINAAANEISSDYFFVFWDDMTVISGPDPRLVQWIRVNKPICAAPILSYENELLPVVHMPIQHNGKFSVWSFPPFMDKTPNMFPFDYCGVYDRTALQRLGGFCPDFNLPYWQLADSGIRSWLGDWRILTCNGLMLSYDRDRPCIDTTENEDYPLFMRRNAGFSFRNGKIKVNKTISGLRISRLEREEIMEIQHWARQDLETLLREWKAPEEGSNEAIG